MLLTNPRSRNSTSIRTTAFCIETPRAEVISPAMTAMVTSNDNMAAGALGAAFDHGLRVPDDLSIVGFDDTEVAGT